MCVCVCACIHFVTVIGNIHSSMHKCAAQTNSDICTQTTPLTAN